uniref:Uncharacterized protein n=1 Tax=Arundo donax TaxID=35708 RepID=A0A0A9QPM7_ARUDO
MLFPPFQEPNLTKPKIHQAMNPNPNYQSRLQLPLPDRSTR